VVGESSIAGDSATHAVSWDASGPHDIGTLGGAQSRALRTSGSGEIFGESQTGDGDTHPFQSWTHQLGLADFSRVLGDDSLIESVIPTSALLTLVSGTAFGLADVHAYLASVPQAPSFDAGAARTITTAPFTFSGFVLGAVRSDIQPPDKLFGIPLKGAGTVRLQLFSCDACVLGDGRRYYDQQQLTYSFEPQ
jgi:hypothetical protein